MPIPVIVACTVGAAAAGVALARLALKEWRRVNAALHPVRNVPVTEKATRQALPKLRRDPKTGVFRPG